MINLLYGPDSYRKHKKAREIIAAYKQKHPQFVFQEFDFSEEGVTLEDLNNFFSSHSLFETLNFAYVKNLLSSKDKKGVKSILKDAVSNGNSFILLYEGEEIPRGFDFLNDAPTLIQVFEKLSKEKILVFIKNESGERNARLSPDLIHTLADTYGSDTWAVVNEIDKLALQRSVPEFEFSAPDNFFSLLNVISGQKDYRTKLPVLERLFAAKEDGVKLFNILASQFVRKGMRVEEMAQYDIATKSGKLDYEVALVDLCLLP